MAPGRVVGLYHELPILHIKTEPTERKPIDSSSTTTFDLTPSITITQDKVAETDLKKRFTGGRDNCRLKFH